MHLLWIVFGSGIAVIACGLAVLLFGICRMSSPFMTIGCILYACGMFMISVIMTDEK